MLVLAADILAKVADAFIVLDREWRIVYANREACRINQKPLSEFQGRTHWEEWPASIGTEVERQYRRAVAEQVAVHFEHHYAAAPYDVWLEMNAYPTEDGLNIFYRDISSRKKAEEALRQFQFLSDNANDAFFLMDAEANFIYVNPTACRQLGYTQEEMTALRVSQIDPQHHDAVYQALFQHAQEETVAPFETLHRRKDGSTFPVEASVSSFRVGERLLLFASTRDISERKTAEQALRDANQRTAGILESITDAFFALDQAWRFTYLNDQAERLLFRTREQLLGRNVWEEFPESVGSTFDQQYHRAAAQQIVVDFEEFYPPFNVWFEVRAYPSPDGLSVYFHDISARKQAENERERLLVELHRRAEREALINRIGQALRSASDPEAVHAEAVNLLGEALGADRCYFAVYDLGNSIVTIAHDWHRSDLPTIQGMYPFANTVEMFQELYRDSNTSVIQDAYTASLSAQTIANMESLQLRSRVSVALVDSEGLMATLTAAMADGPREWSAEDVALIEAVAPQLRTAVEMARVAQREHTIATQLQEALQPQLPGMVPGLALAKYYEPALAQSEGVGGDFFDVFAVEKGCTALVVGDLSGKGLQAASQVSTVRNMLRAFLYSKATVAEAVTDLNRVLAENNLLTGFATLFVGAYDGGTHILNYVNCGQEPALLRRAATGTVEFLTPTGPILGGIENAQFAEANVTLKPGDALAIFTDGLTEVGPSRLEMLGIEGVTALLGQPVPEEEAADANQMAQALILRLIAGVDEAAAGGVMRDDMCLLVGVA